MSLWPFRKKHVQHNLPGYPGLVLVEGASKSVYPDDVAVTALGGLLAAGFDPGIAASHVWAVIVPDFMSERDKYWEQVARTGSLTPLLSTLANAIYPDPIPDTMDDDLSTDKERMMRDLRRFMNDSTLTFERAVAEGWVDAEIFKPSPSHELSGEESSSPDLASDKD